ncbi:MAG: hypothetical protein A2V88_17385 [Elusimicrobia bacterium RBG_16_66_12]|nr:MAG: hypothetical protein A2V88_17385 [Elusimicrobia bacterium RBG_16_66_12]
MVPEKAADIKGGLDEGVLRARGAGEAAGRLDARAKQRTAEMAAALKKSEIKDEIAPERQRWKTASKNHAELTARVEKLPEGPDKRRLQEKSKKAAAALKSADEALRKGEDAAAAASSALQKMKDAQRRAQSPAGELETSAAEVRRLAGLLPGAADEAKARLDLLGQEPRNVSRTRAWDNLEAARGLTSGLFVSADASCSRASELHNQSAAFARAQGDFEKSRAASGAAPAEARPFLDEAEKTLSSVWDSLPQR